MSDFACLIYLTGIYPVCSTALFPSNEVSHEKTGKEHSKEVKQNNSKLN
jgi:hypothetical protein